MYHYTSDITQFMRDFLEKNPKEQERKIKNRNKLWDVNLNVNELLQFELGTISKKPYTYFPNVEEPDESFRGLEQQLLESAEHTLEKEE